MLEVTCLKRTAQKFDTFSCCSERLSSDLRSRTIGAPSVLPTRLLFA